jgi:glycosyltransferase involved in cell wall biosynthesis
MQSNLTLCNSDWTASHVERFLHIKAQTLYPPVLPSGPHSRWDDRRRTFVAMGRISPEKDYERVLRIVARVRAHAPDLTLTIVGTWDASTAAYARRLQELAASLDPAGSWIAIRRDLSRDEVRALLTSTRYGIHGMQEEHFGMAPAEMVRAGMIVWVPNGGGQVEIVGDEPGLRYNSDDEAVDAILHTIGSSTEEARLREHLAARADLFDHRRFMSRILDIVTTFRE